MFHKMITNASYRSKKALKKINGFIKVVSSDLSQVRNDNEVIVSSRQIDLTTFKTSSSFNSQSRLANLYTTQQRCFSSMSSPMLLNNSDVDEWANDKNQMITPKYWTGKPSWKPEEITIDCSNMELTKYLLTYRDGSKAMDLNASMVRAQKDQILHVFNEQGAVHIKNTGFKQAANLRAVMDIANIESMVYKGGANLRPSLSGEPAHSVYETGAPRNAHLHYHHEMAYVKDSCKWIAFMCLENPKNTFKGATFISHQQKATEELMNTPFGQKLKDKGVCYVRKLPDKKFFDDNNLDTSIVYNYWQTSMLSDDPEEAEKIANSKGLEVEWQDSPIFGRYMVTKYYVDTFEYCPYSEKNQLYASVADDYMWFDTWPGVVDLPHHERPLKLNFGDDSIMTREEKQQFVDVYDNHGTPIAWEQGDLAFLCNFRTAHGRPAYSLNTGEKREIGVVLGNLFERQGERKDKW